MDYNNECFSLVKRNTMYLGLVSSSIIEKYFQAILIANKQLVTITWNRLKLMESELLRRRVKSTSYEPQIAIKIANIGQGSSDRSGVRTDLNVLTEDRGPRRSAAERSPVKNLGHLIWFFLLNKFWYLLWLLGDGWHRNMTIMI